VRITVGLREVAGRKSLWQKMWWWWWERGGWWQRWNCAWCV